MLAESHTRDASLGMSKDYLLVPPWSPFRDGENEYDLSHLSEFILGAPDSQGVERRILVTFGDHCFTRDPSGQDDAAPIFPGCSRADGRFCVERYGLSVGIREFLEAAVGHDVWNGDGQHYVIVSGKDHKGNKITYVVVFSLEKSKGFGVELHMHVRSAHKREKDPIETFGSIRFAHLVKLTMEGKRPKKIFDQRRKRPKQN